MFYTVDNEILRDYRGEIITDPDEAIEAAIDEYITEEEYDQWLNDIHEPIEIFGTEYEPSYVLKELSPGDYRVGYSDFTNFLYEDGIYDLKRSGSCWIGGFEIIEEEEEEEGPHSPRKGKENENQGFEISYRSGYEDMDK